MNILKHTLLFATVVIAAVASSVAQAQKSGKPAIDGYDLVSYHQNSGPVPGKTQYQVQHQGNSYLFASQANKTAFAENPAKYLPAYGGFCAYGVAKGKKYKIDPTAYAVIDGTLYLNYDHGVQKKWAKKQDKYIAEANQKWPKIK